MKVAGIMSIVATCATSALVVGCTSEDWERAWTGKTAKEREAEADRQKAIADKEQAIQKEYEARQAKDAKDAVALTEFLGVKFGSEFPLSNDIKPMPDGTYVIPFVPKKQLPGIDIYEVHLTPISHKVFKICAGRKVDGLNPVPFPEGEQIIKALEMRYERKMKWFVAGVHEMEFNGQRIDFDVAEKASKSKMYDIECVHFGIDPTFGIRRLKALDLNLAGVAREERDAQKKAREDAEESAVKKEAEKLKDIF